MPLMIDGQGEYEHDSSWAEEWRGSKWGGGDRTLSQSLVLQGLDGVANRWVLQCVLHCVLQCVVQCGAVCSSAECVVESISGDVRCGWCCQEVGVAKRWVLQSVLQSVAVFVAV